MPGSSMVVDTRTGTIFIGITAYHTNLTIGTDKPGPEVIKLFLCSTQLSLKKYVHKYWFATERIKPAQELCK